MRFLTHDTWHPTAERKRQCWVSACGNPAYTATAGPVSMIAVRVRARF
jgi:hypothetical protein